MPALFSVIAAAAVVAGGVLVGQVATPTSKKDDGGSAITEWSGRGSDQTVPGGDGDPAGSGLLGAAPSASPSPSPSPSAGAPKARKPASRQAPRDDDTPMPRPSAWPGPADTGVPAGVTLTSYSGSRISKDNTVIDGKNLGCVEIYGKNVTIKRSKITCRSEMVRIFDRGSVTIEDTEMDGQGRGFVIGYDNYTLRRVNAHNFNEGPRVGNNVTIVDSWFHNMVIGSPGDHQDVLQTTGGRNIVIRHNTLDATAPPGELHNAAFMVGAEVAGYLENMTVEGNLIGGGGYSINIRTDPGIRNVVFRNNTFKRDSEWGAVVRREANGVTWERNNVWQDNGRAV